MHIRTAEVEAIGEGGGSAHSTSSHKSAGSVWCPVLHDAAACGENETTWGETPLGVPRRDGASIRSKLVRALQGSQSSMHQPAASAEQRHRVLDSELRCVGARTLSLVNSERRRNAKAPVVQSAHAQQSLPGKDSVRAGPVSESSTADSGHNLPLIQLLDMRMQARVQCNEENHNALPLLEACNTTELCPPPDSTRLGFIWTRRLPSLFRTQSRKSGLFAKQRAPSPLRDEQSGYPRPLNNVRQFECMGALTAQKAGLRNESGPHPAIRGSKLPARASTLVRDIQRRAQAVDGSSSALFRICVRLMDFSAYADVACHCASDVDVNPGPPAREYCARNLRLAKVQWCEFGLNHTGCIAKHLPPAKLAQTYEVRPCRQIRWCLVWSHPPGSRVASIVHVYLNPRRKCKKQQHLPGKCTAVRPRSVLALREATHMISSSTTSLGALNKHRTFRLPYLRKRSLPSPGKGTVGAPILALCLCPDRYHDTYAVYNSGVSKGLVCIPAPWRIAATFAKKRVRGPKYSLIFVAFDCGARKYNGPHGAGAIDNSTLGQLQPLPGKGTAHRSVLSHSRKGPCWSCSGAAALSLRARVRNIRLANALAPSPCLLKYREHEQRRLVLTDSPRHPHELTLFVQQMQGVCARPHLSKSPASIMHGLKCPKSACRTRGAKLPLHARLASKWIPQQRKRYTLQLSITTRNPYCCPPLPSISGTRDRRETKRVLCGSSDGVLAYG
ncbi:hypothetical protein C8R47DRAFT_1081408 [Mycena vitilis]|nr:hypothetical protein C8R47DRAFT_1081408 [Mycena vitilis]